MYSYYALSQVYVSIMKQRRRATSYFKKAPMVLHAAVLYSSKSLAVHIPDTRQLGVQAPCSYLLPTLIYSSNSIIYQVGLKVGSLMSCFFSF